MGILRKDIIDSIKEQPESPFRTRGAFSYRSMRGVAVWLKFEIPAGAAPFTVSAAMLEGEGQRALKVLGVWPPRPLVPDTDGTAVVIVEAQWAKGVDQVPYTLTLVEAGGQRIIIKKVTFP
jgi:hypothetical protein